MEVVKKVEVKDLSAVNLSGKNDYEKFELSLPFSRTALNVYAQCIRNAEIECGN